MKRKLESETQKPAIVQKAADDAGETAQQSRRASTSRLHRASITMRNPNSTAAPTSSRSVISGTHDSNFGLLRRSRRQTAPTTSTVDNLVDGKMSSMSGHQHGGAVQVMQQADFSHVSALTTMALPSLMASYHASMCQQQQRLSPRISTTDASEVAAQRRASRLSVAAAPSTAVSDVSSGARGRAVSTSVAAEELLVDEYERLNKAMTPDMEAKALGGDADDQDYSMYVQSCKLDVAMETTLSTKKQLRTVSAKTSRIYTLHV